jgi:hypothetical protein
MSSMRKCLTNLMRFLLSSLRWSSQEYHRPTKLRTCSMTTIKETGILKKPRLQWKVAKWLSKICSMCENMTIWVKIWFHWIFVWNMFNVWKYDHLCEYLAFIWYLCEICSMCENMAIWCLNSVSKVCAVSKALCSVFDGHYTESGNVFSFWWRKRETRSYYVCLSS